MRKCRFCRKEIADASTVCEHCGKDLFPGRAPAPAAAPTAVLTGFEKLVNLAGTTIGKPPVSVTAIRCKTCDVGTLQSKKKYRMSGIVVAIGYILLVPSVLGMLFSLVLLFATGKAGSDTTSRFRDSAATRLRDVGIVEPLVQKVVSSQPLTEAEEGTLSRDQRTRVESVQSTITASTVGAGAGLAIAGGAAIFLGMMALVGGLLGWLLIMKKKILQCNNCGAVIAAS
jgi:hypothetical protein